MSGKKPAHLPDPSRVARVHPREPDREIIQTAGNHIRNGGVVIFPTRCLYGLGADASDPDAVSRVFRLKRRPPDNPVLVLIPDRDWLTGLVATIPARAASLMDTFWPGSLTLVFDAGDRVCPLLTAGTGKIGIRVPAHPVARALVRAAGCPITGTSANISGTPGICRVPDLPDELIRGAGLTLDCGPLAGGIGSTVVDITTDPPRILRQGMRHIPLPDNKTG